MTRGFLVNKGADQHRGIAGLTMEERLLISWKIWKLENKPWETFRRILI